MSSKKTIRGETETECINKLKAFMTKHNQAATRIAEQIVEVQKVPFSPHSIYNWISGDSSMTFKVWNRIEKHMSRYEK